jgi:hypothetical protein
MLVTASVSPAWQGGTGVGIRGDMCVGEMDHSRKALRGGSEGEAIFQLEDALPTLVLAGESGGRGVNGFCMRSLKVQTCSKQLFEGRILFLTKETYRDRALTSIGSCALNPCVCMCVWGVRDESLSDDPQLLT